MSWSWLFLCVAIQLTVAVKVKVLMHSEEDSVVEDDEAKEGWDRRRHGGDVPVLPFLKASTKHNEEKPDTYIEKLTTTEKSRLLHPNDMLFPLIYKQNHINNMFKFGDKWFTWSTEKRKDGSKATNYYVCYDEPKHCDEIGWDRIDSLPKCAFQIDSVMSDDRVCVNPFGIEPHSTGECDGAEQMKVSEMVRSCGPRLRSLWRFVRVGRRPTNAAKPADVNSLLCEDEEECYISIEYRIHHDRITFSLHEPSRGQTFKSALKRETAVVEEKPVTQRARPHHARTHTEETTHSPKIRVRPRYPETKHIKHSQEHEHNDSGYVNRRLVKNKLKIRDDVSEDMSD
ncbi:hypothetical protein ACJJTC_000908 [Scirpophaga incertulas]